ncbi:MAG: cation:proton antiporter [Pseudomonadota bacterium]
MGGDTLLLAFVFLIAGVIAVPIATRFGLGSVLGYLIAGIVIGPILTQMGADVVSIQHFAEFGVVMMLFLVGLELEPKTLWEMRSRLLGLGGLQVVLSTGLIMLAAMALGQAWTVALTIGLLLSLSSTAIVLQTLNEKGLLRSDGGQGSFSILLMQDIAVIPMLALIPLLAMPELADTVVGAGGQGAEAAGQADHGAGHGSDHGGDHDDGHGTSLSLVDGLPGWGQALVTIGAVAAVIVGGNFLTRPVFRYIASAGLRELFTATALMMVIGIALLMTLVGLSPALGTFVAGVVLANSEWRHELESDIDPFRGLLLGLFFMTVGAGIDFGLLGANLGPILGLTAGLIALKALVLFGLGAVFGINGSDRWLMALGLAQAGEFGFVLLSFSTANNVLPDAVADQLLLVVALSMLVTPLLFILFDRVILPRFASSESGEPDEIAADGPIIIAGHGRVGGIVNRVLRGAGYETVVLDFSAAQLEMLRTFGFRAFYGDATRPDLLQSAGIANARLFVVAIDDRTQANEVVRYVTKAFPNVHVMARARDRNHVYELYAAGSRDIIRETFDSSMRMGRSALEALGVHPYEAERQVRAFEARDRHALVELAQLYDPDIPIQENAPYVARARELAAEAEAELRGDTRGFTTGADRGWSPPSVSDVEAEAARDRSEG